MNANFEQYAREQLTGHEVQVNAEALWADIYPQVQPAEGNRKIFWFFIFGAFVVLAGLGIFYNNNASNTTIITDPDVDIASDVNAVISSQLAEKNIKGKTPNTESETTSGSFETTTAIQNTTKEASIVQSNLKAKNTISLPPAKVNTAEYENTNLAQAVKSTDLKPSVVSLFVEEKDDDNLAGNDLVDENTISFPIRNISSTARIPSLYPKALDYDRLKNFDITAFKPKLKSVLAGDLPAKEGKKKRKNKPDILRNMKFGLGLYTGLSRSSADLEADSEGAVPFVIARTNAEKQLETIHFGLNAFIQTDKGLYLRTGAEYTRIGSLFSRNAEQITMDTTQGIIEYEISSITGDTINIIEGDVIVTRTTRYNKKSYNYFHLVDVPVIFGYNFGENDDDWRIGVEAGIYANVFIKNKGEIPLEDGSFYDIGDDPKKWYKTNVGIRPYVGVNVAYNMSQNLQLHLTPSFRFNAVYSTDANLLTEKHGTLGVQAGIRYFFD